MKRPSRIVLTCVATTSAVTGVAFTINSVAAAATGSTVAAATGPATPGFSVAKGAELQRQSLLLRSQIGTLEKAIAAESLKLRPSASPSPYAGTESAQAPVLIAAPLAPVGTAPAPSWSPPQPVAATAAPATAGPVAAPSSTAPAPPPVHTSTGASGAAAAGNEPSDGGSDD